MSTFDQAPFLHTPNLFRYFELSRLHKIVTMCSFFIHTNPRRAICSKADGFLGISLGSQLVRVHAARSDIDMGNFWIIILVAL